MTLNLLQGLIVGFAVVTIVSTGAKRRWGWAVGVASEGVWACYAWAIHSWGLMVLCVVYAALYGRNWWSWR